MVTDYETQLKQDIDSFIEEKKEAKNINESLIGKQDFVVSLELISMEQPMHKINKTAFEHIQLSNKFIWNKLNGAKPFVECKENSQRRKYFVVPLRIVSGNEMEIDYDTIKRICWGSSRKLNAQEWINKIKPSRLKHGLVQFKNELCISYGIHNDLYLKNKEIKVDEPINEIIAEPKDDQSDVRTVKSFCCNESVEGRFEDMGAGGRKKLRKEKNVILTRTINPEIGVKCKIYKGNKCFNNYLFVAYRMR